MKKTILLPIILLFIILTVGAVKPTQQNILTSSQLIILQPEIEIFMQYEQVELHFHVLNSTAAILNSSAKEVNCSIHIYNSSNTHIFRGFLDADDDDMEIKINTNYTGIFTFNMWCYAPGTKLNAKEYGYLSSYYYVTTEGKNYSTGDDGLSGLVIIAGVFAVCFLLLYTAFKLDKEKHFILQLIILMFTVVVMILIPKGIIDFTNNFATAGIFYKATTWFIRIFWGYMFFYLLFEIFTPLKNLRLRFKK